MHNATETSALATGEWTVRLHPPAGIELVHAATGIALQGTLAFRGPGGAWSVGAARDGVACRPALLDPQGNVQGYLAIGGDGGHLDILVLHRCAQSYHGTVTLTAEVAMPGTPFACRTAAASLGRVIQMGSGPADSTLNDALFDRDTDTALRFAGASVGIVTCAPGRFTVRLTADIAAAGRAAVSVHAERGFYRRRYVPYYRPIDRRRCPSPPTGWMSWNVYFDTAGAAENLAEARIGAEHLRPFGLEFWSIESWQENSDRLPVRDFHNLNLRAHPGQFPEGMAKLAEDIRALGFRPGIWTVPFGTGNQAFYEAHKDWFLHDSGGKPMANWCGRYLLDPTVPEAIDHMRHMHAVMRRDWGYVFFKVDGMSGRSPGYSAHFYERDEVKAAFRNPCPNPFERCVEAIREGMGEDAVFLACQGHYSGPEAAQADASRIGGDIVSPNRPSTWENILSQARATVNQLFVHTIVLYSDPDTLLVGTYHGLEQARVTATVVALPGQMMFAGDKLAELPASRMRLLQQSLPVCDVHPMDLFPRFDLPPVWNLKVRRAFGTWDVTALFNWSDADAEVGVTLAELGLAETGAYLAYEFWEGRFLGRIGRDVALTVPARGVRLLVIHPDLGHPQVVSTDRHLTQGATSLEDMRWDAASRALALRVALVADHTTTVTLFLPPPYTCIGLRAETGVTAGVDPGEAGLLHLRLAAAESRLVTVTVRF